MSSQQDLLFWITENRVACGFPDVAQALSEPDGLLAAGGDLSAERLLDAYQRGIFPWYEEGQPILWWSPDPRTVLYPEHIKVSRSLRRTLKRGQFRVTIDRAFGDVMQACAAPRSRQRGTWITDEILDAYTRLHHQGHAHSIEYWSGQRLAGGLYGVAIGRIFFGESMFSRCDDASKVCLVVLCNCLREWGYALIDCQVQSAHLMRLGAELEPRREFTQMLSKWCTQAPAANAWRGNPGAALT